MPLKDKQVNKEIKEEMKKMHGDKVIENTTVQNLGDSVKPGLRGKYVETSRNKKLNLTLHLTELEKEEQSPR